MCVLLLWQRSTRKTFNTDISVSKVQKYLLQFDRTFTIGVIHWMYIYNNVEYHQLILPFVYRTQVLQTTHYAQGHQDLDHAMVLARELEFSVQRHFSLHELLLMLSGSKGQRTGLHSQTRCIANKPLNLSCTDFIKIDLFKGMKEKCCFEDAFSKFS